MKQLRAKVQVGKNGLTSNLIISIKNSLYNHSQVRLPILKSATRKKEDLLTIKDKIENKLKNDFKCSYRILGYTIIITKLKNLKKS